MRFETFSPSPSLQAYVRRFAISESESAGTYTVFPSTTMVIGFQFRGQLSVLRTDGCMDLAPSGITGLTDGYQVFSNAPGIGTVLVYFTETGLSHFTPQPAHELFNCNLPLESIFRASDIRRVEEQLQQTDSDQERIQIVEGFLLGQLREIQADRLVIEGIRRLHAARGQVRIAALVRELAISQSPFEKRFRKVVGTSPKKFASVLRFQNVVAQIGSGMSLADICYANQYFDQSHFTKDFQHYTGSSPEQFLKQH